MSALEELIDFARRRAAVSVGARRERFYAQRSSAVAGSEAWSGVWPSSLSITSLKTDRLSGPRVSLVVPRIRRDAMFAGIRTALEVAVSLAKLTERPLRVLSIDGTLSPRQARLCQDYISREFAFPSARIEVTRATAEPSVGAADLWVASYWTTAHALQVATLLGTIDPSHVIYLIQDFEPGFFPWSTEQALAEATYTAGFTPLVNTTVLAAYLSRRVGLQVPSDQVFGPRLDLARLQETARRRGSSDLPRILFYARPSKPRNLYRLGVAALKLAAQKAESNGFRLAITTAGEPHGRFETASGTALALGTLRWEDYFRVLSETDVVLSLQNSPHPSHPPLDAVVSGARAVTNEFDNGRSSLDRCLAAAPAEPSSIASALIEAVQSRADEPSTFRPDILQRLGGDMGKSVEATLHRTSIR